MKKQHATLALLILFFVTAVTHQVAAQQRQGAVKTKKAELEPVLMEKASVSENKSTAKPASITKPVAEVERLKLSYVMKDPDNRSGETIKLYALDESGKVIGSEKMDPIEIQKVKDEDEKAKKEAPDQKFKVEKAN